MPFDENIVQAKEDLKNALGERFNLYMDSMKKWFRGKLSKEEFDIEARTIVTENKLHLHNHFLLCIIRKCHNFATETDLAASKLENVAIKTEPQQQPLTKKSKTTTQKQQQVQQQRYIPIDIQKYAQPAQLHENLAKNLEYCSREHTLPYIKLIHGRLLISILDWNLETIDLNCIFLMSEITILFLKNILTKLISNHKQLRESQTCKKYGKQFFHYSNSLNEKKKKENRIGPEWEEEDEELKMERKQELNELNYLCKESMLKPNKNINLYELKSVLKENRYLMPSHTVYTITMEKIMCNLWYENDDNYDNDNFAINE